ncbi:hypothetical protein CLAIMM_04252 [Cladophialophora immunda]|nr:hypothetical protein CLAIMM_04252 [Cladophialophora immunda]
MTVPTLGGPSFADRQDYDDASRGFIAALSPCIITAQDGRVVWNNDQYRFLEEECPPTAEPGLWRQGQLCLKQGLFRVTDGIYQVRGFDISNLTLVEGEKGVIAIDPLVSCECASAALAFYREHRGPRPITGLVFSHSHADHFGGAQGILDSATTEGLAATTASPSHIPIIAPEGFLEEAISENVHLEPGPEGFIGCGLGIAGSWGTRSLIPPNVSITRTGEELVVDGVRIIFQLVPETEAPSEMNFYFPDCRALLIAECATHCMHNIITLRGALVRDSKAWSAYLDETMVLYCQDVDVLLASHHWPTWGRSNVITLISEQRDFYAYLHDQTIRMMNDGLTGIEIAEKLTLPPRLQQAWHLQGYYGSISHNVKGIYQRYLGWFDGNPAHLWQHPPAEEGQRYIRCMGGADEVVATARIFAQEGDLRFSATLLSHVIAAEPEHAEARAALASVYKRLAYATENATWRNFYLTGAQDMEQGARPERAIEYFIPTLPVDQWLTSLAVLIDGPRAGQESAPIIIEICVPSEQQRWRLTLSNGALTHRRQPTEHKTFVGDPAGLTMTLDKEDLLRMLNGQVEEVLQDGKKWTGDLHLFVKLLALTSTTQRSSTVASVPTHGAESNGLGSYGAEVHGVGSKL